jgi:acyl carrier protein
MNPNTDRIQTAIQKAITSANQARRSDSQLACSPTAALYGPGSPLDSLGLVNILIDIEDELRSCGMEVSLSDERAMSQTRSPFRSVAALVEYIEGLLAPTACQP